MKTAKIRIHDELKKACANKLALGVVFASIKVTNHNKELWEEINSCISELAKIPVEDIAALPQVKALRATYKVLGKDPSRYRGSNEALLRRISQGKGLYKVNTIVDINNLISLESRRSVASYDREKLGNDLVFRPGMDGESYQAIGKGSINIEGLPVFADESGPFGSSTSDSQRAMITADTIQLLVAIISFDGEQGLDTELTRAMKLLEKYATAADVSDVIVR
ncbi:MAG: B3/4 domain-containing protein [Acidiferrobacterales bacterium]